MKSEKPNISFYKGEDKLIRFNPQSKVYRIGNAIENNIITEEEFNSLNPVKIKRDKFSQLMNEYFKDVNHHWYYEGRRYRKMPNFETNETSFSSNYVIGKEVPIHKIEKVWNDRYILVYHWGNIYYHTIDYGGYGVGQLVDPKTMNLVRWARLKNCSPIFDVEPKKII